MPFQTLYTIKTTGAPIQAHDYEYRQDGLLVYPVCEDGITPHLYPVTVPWEQYQGIEFREIRLAQDPTPAPLQDPAPIAETFIVTAQPDQKPTRTAPERLPQNTPTTDPADLEKDSDHAEPIQEEPAPPPTKKLGTVLGNLEFRIK